MDIEIPAGLDWVAYLAGSAWPQGSETAMSRIGGYWHAHAAKLETQMIPDLQTVRSKIQAVLTGDTAQAAERQFAKLFDGDYSVDKLAKAMHALGDAAENLGTEIQYTKLQILTTLAIAAASITWALANSPWTAGASLAQIPIFEWLAQNAISRAVSMALQRITTALAEKLGSTMVARLLVEGAVSAGIGAAQEAGIEGVQVIEGHRDGIGVRQVLHSALSMGAAGVAGGVVGHGVGELLGGNGNTAMRALKGAVTGLSSAEAGNVAATVVGGGNVGAATFLGGAIGFVHGVARGAGEHGSGGGDGASVADPPKGPVRPDAVGVGDDARDPAGPASAASDAAASANDAAPQAHSAAQPAASAETANVAGDRGGGAPANDPPAASDPGPRSSEGSTNGRAPSQGDVAGGLGPRSSQGLPAAGTEASGIDRVTADTASAPAAPARLDASTQQDATLSMASPAADIGRISDAGNAPLPEPSGSPDAASAPPRAAAPDPSPAASSDRGPSSPPKEAQAGLPESSATGHSADTAPGMAGARAVEGTAEGRSDADHGGREPAAGGPGEGSGVDRAAQAGRAGTEAHLVGRDQDAADRSQPPTTRRDPSTRPDSAPDDSTSPRARPGKLPRRIIGERAAEDIGLAAGPRDGADAGLGQGGSPEHEGVPAGGDGRGRESIPDESAEAAAHAAPGDGTAHPSSLPSDTRRVRGIAVHGSDGDALPSWVVERALAAARGEDFVVGQSVEQRLEVQAREALTDWLARRGMDRPPPGWPSDQPWPPPDVAEKPRWDALDTGGLGQRLAGDDDQERLGAFLEVVYRETGRVLRPNQVMTLLALHEGTSAELGPGGGKTVSSGVAAAWLALDPDRGSATVSAHIRYLANAAHDEFDSIWSKYGITAVRWTSHGEHPNPDGPTVYFSTRSEQVHAFQAGHDTGSRVLIVDEAHRLKPGERYSTVRGGDRPATNDEAAMTIGARDFLEEHLKLGNLTEADFRDPGRPAALAAVREDSLPKVGELIGGRQPTDAERRALDYAASAHFDYDRNRYFVSDDNKIVLIDPDTGDPEGDKQAHSLSHLPREMDLALKAKERLELTASPEDAVRTTAEEYFGPQGGRFDHRVAMSGTMHYPEVKARLARLGFAEIAEMPDHYEPLLHEFRDTVLPDVAAKLDHMITQALQDHAVGRPVLMVLPSETELARTVEMLAASGIVPDHIVDAKNVYEQGPEMVQDVAAVAGHKGQITVATQIVDTGFDAPLGPGVAELGGLAVHCASTDLSPEQRIQIGRRAARPGATPNPGSARFYGSPDTAHTLSDLHPHEIIQYLTQHQGTDPAPDTEPQPAYAAQPAIGAHDAAGEHTTADAAVDPSIGDTGANGQRAGHISSTTGLAAAAAAHPPAQPGPTPHTTSPAHSASPPTPPTQPASADGHADTRSAEGSTIVPSAAQTNPGGQDPGSSSPTPAAPAHTPPSKLPVEGKLGLTTPPGSGPVTDTANPAGLGSLVQSEAAGVSSDLLAAADTVHPLAAEETNVVGARYDDRGAAPGEPGSGDAPTRSDRDNTEDRSTDTAGHGAGAGRDDGNRHPPGLDPPGEGAPDDPGDEGEDAEATTNYGNRLYDVVAAAVAGNEHAVEELLATIRPIVVRYCAARWADRGGISAEDLAQDTLLTIVRALPHYKRRRRPFLSFVTAVAENKVRAAVRHLGERLLDGTGVHAVKYLSGGAADDPAPSGVSAAAVDVDGGMEPDWQREERAAQQEFDQALARAQASGEPEVRTLKSSPVQQLELHTFPNGFQMQVETYLYHSDARTAVLMFRCAQAIGAPIGRPYQYDDPFVVRREYKPEPEPDSPEGRLYGLYEVLAGRDGPHAQHFRDAATAEFKDHELPLSEIFRIRQQVAAQVHEFEAEGLEHVSRTLLRDLAEIELHALHTRAERRARDGLTPDAREKFRLLDEMRRQEHDNQTRARARYPELVGFDHPYVPADAVRQVKRAIDDFMADHGERARLGRVAMDLLPRTMGLRRRPYAEASSPGAGTVGGCTITLDLGLVADPGRMQSRMSRDLQTGFYARGTGKGVYDKMMHELGHVMDFCSPDYVVETLHSGNVVSSTRESIVTHVEAVLCEVHRRLVDHDLIGGDDQDYGVWIRRLPGYAFHDDAKTRLNAVEAIGVGVEEVQINGGMVGWPQWVIHHYTTTGRIPVITDDLKVHLPAAPEQPEEFRLPDWQAIRRVLQDMHGRDIADDPALRGDDVSPAELASAFSDFRRVDRDRVTPEALGRYLLDSPPETALLLADVQYSGDGYSFDKGCLSLATSRGGHIEITSQEPRAGIARQPGVIRYIVGFRPDGTPFNPIPQLPDAPDANDEGDRTRTNRDLRHQGPRGEGGGPNDTGRDGESHLVEDFIRNHRPPVDAVENWELVDDVRDIGTVVSEISGREIHIEPEPKVMLISRLFQAAGTDEQIVTGADMRAEIEATLGYLGPVSSAIVRVWVPSTDILIHLIGRVFLAVNRHDDLFYYDPRTGILSDRPPWSEGQKVQISVGYLDAHGKAWLPFDPHNRRRWGLHVIAMNAWLAELPEARKSQLADDIQVLNADFASAMDRVALGSDEANRLAERHLALAQELGGDYDDYDYELHRYFGRRMVTEARLRDRYESRASGLARYVRDVIVANAERHLGPPDNPEAPHPVGPRQPGNPPSGLDAGDHVGGEPDDQDPARAASSGGGDVGPEVEEAAEGPGAEHRWASPLDPGAVDQDGRPVTHREYPLDDYVRGRAVGPERRATLGRGCVGVVLDRLGHTDGMPAMRIAFGDVQSRGEIANLEKVLAPVEAANRVVAERQLDLTEAKDAKRKYETAPGFRGWDTEIELSALKHLEWCERNLAEARKQAERILSWASRWHNVEEMMAAKKHAKIEGSKRVFAKVFSYANELNTIFATRPADAGEVVRLVQAHPGLRPLHDIEPSLPSGGNPEGWEAVIIYKDLWSGQSKTLYRTQIIGDTDDTWVGTETPDPARFAPDPQTGRVDMSKDLHQGRPGYVTFNYAWYDPETNSWWGAERDDSDPEHPMSVKQMTDEHLFADLLDYDTPIFSIQIVNRSS